MNRSGRGGSGQRAPAFEVSPSVSVSVSCFINAAVSYASLLMAMMGIAHLAGKTVSEWTPGEAG